MREIKDYFSISSEYESTDDIVFPKNAILFYATSYEERSTLFSELSLSPLDINIINIEELPDQRIALNTADSRDVYNFRSRDDINAFKIRYENFDVYLDITGLTHSSWAWLVRALISRVNGIFYVMYAEPDEYKFHDHPFDGQLFDLSDRINGIAPLPTFASLTQYTSDNSVFMPLLGFEGARFAHIFEDVQPSRKYTFPVFGVPGFRYNFPFYTYQGNKATLEREGVWKNYRYERANCPVSVFVLGSDIMNKHPDKFLRIALVGTKPHALGAVLLKLCYPSKVDLIYDHPTRKKGRTIGQSRIFCYSMNPFKELIK